MKKLILSVLAAIAITPMAYALPLTKSGPNAYTGNLINESGLAYSTTVALDLSAYAANKVSVVVVYSSANFTASTFTDGTVSTGNITVVSTTALAGKYLTSIGWNLWQELTSQWDTRRPQPPTLPRQ